MVGGIVTGVRMRSAVAMIELILALVVMGIVLMSAPQLIATAKQSSITMLKQEAIALGASHMTMVLSRQWDEANTNPNIEITILNTATDTATPPVGLQPSIGGVRAGTPIRGKHRSFFDAAGNTYSATAPNTLGSDANDNSIRDDMDDFDQTIATLVLSGSSGTDDYVDRQMQMATSVSYISDLPNGSVTNYSIGTNTLTYNMPTGAQSNSTHIKYIQVILTSGQAASSELNTTIIFDAFSCNIGRHYYRSRVL